MGKTAMSIGVDIDGVLTDFERFVNSHGIKYFKKTRNTQIVDPNGFDVDQVFGVSKKQLRKFWRKHCYSYCIAESARDGASEVISALRREGKTITIITGRMKSYNKNLLGVLMRNSVKFWLWKNNIEYDKIIFCQENDNKVEICNDLGIEIIVEDKPQNILAISKAIPTICVDASYNRECCGENIFRVKDFAQMQYLISEIADCREKK